MAVNWLLIPLRSAILIQYKTIFQSLHYFVLITMYVYKNMCIIIVFFLLQVSNLSVNHISC